MLAGQPEAQWQLTFAWAPNCLLKLERIFITTVNSVSKVLSSSPLGHRLVNGIVGELRPGLYECLQVYESRIILPIIIDPFVILFSQELCSCDNSLTGGTNTQILIEILFDDDMVGLIMLS